MENFRAAKGRAEERAYVEHLTTEMSVEEAQKAKEQIQKITERITELESNLARGNEMAMQEKNPEARARYTQVGREITQTISNLQTEKEGLEAELAKKSVR